MPHQCVRCSRIIPTGSRELLEGCNDCKGHFFFYVREERLEKIKENPIVIPEPEKKKIEKDVREMAGITDEDSPVILDLESVRAVGSGKFEIDIVNLFNKKRPLIYKLDEGKYIIDLASTLKRNMKDATEIINPEE
ncbi:MAG: Zn-ribbon containing protein [Candidatus Pacearchaeota archaeon]|jgi:predicted  nucleic acid-binding Zn-ribbon protein